MICSLLLLAKNEHFPFLPAAAMRLPPYNALQQSSKKHHRCYAKKEAVQFSLNITHQLLLRETAPMRPGCFMRKSFSNYKLQKELETYDPEATQFKLSFLRKRSRIIEIVSSGDLFFALTQTGVCTVFRAGASVLQFPL
jgi:hypothetical protein